jgi:predicted metal-binding membrane protein
MWWIMMIGMMVPSAAPTILIFALVLRKNLPPGNPGRNIGLFTLGYLLMSLGVSAGTAGLQWGLGEFALFSPMMATISPDLTTRAPAGV